MGNAQSEAQSSTITITATTVAILISALCAWFWSHNKQLIDQNTLSYPDRIEVLEQQLQQRSSYETHTKQDLLNKYSEVLKVNVSLEKALATSVMELGYLEENLSTHQMDDWENKYPQEKAGNDQIFESMARQEEEVERLKEIQETLDWDHQRTLESERSNYLERIGALKLKLATSTKANKKLKNRHHLLLKKYKQQQQRISLTIDQRACSLL